MSRNGKPEELPPPAVIHLVTRTCDLAGCERTFRAHAEAPLTWCSAAHRKLDARSGLVG